MQNNRKTETARVNPKAASRNDNDSSLKKTTSFQNDSRNRHREEDTPGKDTNTFSKTGSKADLEKAILE